MVGLDLPFEAFNLPAQIEHLPKILYQFGNLAIVASLASLVQVPIALWLWREIK
jgi:hypothetical protein